MRAGTAVLDGLIEGPLPPIEDGEERLRQWVAFAREHGVNFHLSLHGARFSVLADSKPLPCARHEDFQARVREAMDGLLQMLPEDSRPQVFSTVRSVEFREETQRQSLYLVAPGGIQVRDREVERREKEPPAVPLRRAFPFLMGGAAIVATLLASSLLVDYPAVWRSIRARYGAIDPKRIAVHGADVSRYVVVRDLGVDKTRTYLELEVRRGMHFPTDTTTYKAEEERLVQKGDIRDIVALHRVVLHGALQVHYLDDRGRQLGETEVSIRGLLDKSTIRILLPFKPYPGVRRLRFTF